MADPEKDPEAPPDEPAAEEAEIKALEDAPKDEEDADSTEQKSPAKWKQAINRFPWAIILIFLGIACIAGALYVAISRLVASPYYNADEYQI